MKESNVVALAGSVMRQAAEDYCRAKRKLKDQNLKRASRRCWERKVKELERFFASEWCTLLCLGNSDYVVARIKREAEEVV